MSRFRKLLTGAASGALQAAPSHNPWLIAGNAALQGGLSALTYQEPFKRKPFEDRFAKYKKRALSAVEPYAAESASQNAQSFAAKGLGDSPLATGIAQASKRRLYSQMLNQLNTQEHALQSDLDKTELADDLKRSNEFKREIGAIAGQAGGLVSDHIASEKKKKDASEKKKKDFDDLFSEFSDGVKGSDKGGKDKVDLGGSGVFVDKNSAIAGLFERYGDTLHELGLGMAGGISEIVKLFVGDEYPSYDAGEGMPPYRRGLKDDDSPYEPGHGMPPWDDVAEDNFSARLDKRSEELAIDLEDSSEARMQLLGDPPGYNDRDPMTPWRPGNFPVLEDNNSRGSLYPKMIKDGKWQSAPSLSLFLNSDMNTLSKQGLAAYGIIPDTWVNDGTVLTLDDLVEVGIISRERADALRRGDAYYRGFSKGDEMMGDRGLTEYIDRF